MPKLSNCMKAASTLVGLSLAFGAPTRGEGPDGASHPRAADEAGSPGQAQPADSELELPSALAGGPQDPAADDDAIRSPGRPRRDPARFGPPSKYGTRHGRGPFPHRRHTPTEEQVNEAMAFLKEHWPERHALIAKLQQEDPQAFGLALQSIWPQLARLIELSYDNPELAKVEVETVKLEAQILRATRALHVTASQAGLELPKEGDDLEDLPDQLKEPVNRLKDLIGQRFDLHMKQSELRIQELTEQLAYHRQRLEEARKDKQDEVARILKDLMYKQLGPKRPEGLRGAGGRARYFGRQRRWLQDEEPGSTSTKPATTRAGSPSAQ